MRIRNLFVVFAGTLPGFFGFPSGGFVVGYSLPVACVAINGARNAGLLAVQILATADPALRARYADYKKNLVRQSRAKDKALRKRIG